MDTSYSINSDQDFSRKNQANVAANILYSGMPHNTSTSSASAMNGYAGHENSRMTNHIQSESHVSVRRFSPVRRLFCLLAVFDFLFLSILWFFYSQLLGLKSYNGITCQVVEYTFQTSMFDITVLSFWRMSILLLVYGVIHSKRWYIVVFSTLVTNIMVIAKVFLYGYATATAQLPTYCNVSDKSNLTNVAYFFMLIASFVISWFELWTFDFQVLPREKRLEEALLRSRSSSDETTPLLNNQPNSIIPHHVINTYQVRPGQQPYYSPYDSPADSEQEESESSSQYSSGGRDLADFQSLPNSQRESTINLAASIQEQKYVQKSQEAMDTFKGILKIKDGWTTHKTVESAAVSTRKIDIAVNGKFFRLVAILPARVERVFEIMWDEFELSPDWNPTLKSVEIVQFIGSDIQVEHSITNPVGGGLVSSRDFVSIRQHLEEGKRHVVSDVSIEYHSKPPTKEHVRGENGCSGWMVEPADGDGERCKLSWYINSDAKLKFAPQNLYESIMCTSLIDIYNGLCKHIEKTGLASFREVVPGSPGLVQTNSDNGEDQEDDDDQEDDEESSDEEDGIVEKIEDTDDEDLVDKIDDEEGFTEETFQNPR